MLTESKQLTPTEKLNLAYSTNGIDAGVPYNFALELATELERVQRQNTNLLIQQGFDETCRAQLKQEQVFLLQERDELKRQVEELKKTAEYWVREHGIENEKRGEAEHALAIALGDKADYCALLERERDQLRAENTELRKDKERLDWLTNAVGDTRQATEQVIKLYQDDATHDFFVKEIPNEKTNRMHYGRTLRQALDEAMKGK